MAPLTRRRLLASAGAGAAGIGLGAGGCLVGGESAGDDAAGTGMVAFHGEHQAGIARGQPRAAASSATRSASSSPSSGGSAPATR